MGVLGETAVKITADTSSFHASASKGILGSVAKIGASAAAIFGGIKLGKALFTDPMKAAGDFQQSLNVLQATSHATNAQMKTISATAMKLGADVKLPAVSASDAAKAMLELAKGGFSAQQSMDAARGVLLLSTAAEIDGAQAARLVADGLHAFGMQAKDASVLVDDFAGAANVSTASMDEVAQALQQSGQMFHQLGIPVGDAATAIAAMANAGIKGSDAGTSLKTMLQRLTPQTTQAKKAFKEMGVDVFDSHGKFVGLEKTIQQFRPALQKMTQEQRAQALQTIFGSDASRAANVILGMSAKQFDALRDKVTKSGSAQKLADAQTKGFNGAMSALHSTIETLQLKIGLALLPVLTRLAKFAAENLPAAFDAVASVVARVGDIIGEVVAVVQAHMDQIKRVIQTSIGVLQEVFDKARGIVLGLVSAITNLVGWLNQNRDVALALAGFIATLVAGFIAYQAAMLAVRGALLVATAAQWLLNAAMTANPIGIVVVAIAALVAGLILLYQRSETAARIMDAAWALIKQGAKAAMDFITNTVIPNAIAAWNRFGPQVVAALSAAASTIRTVVQAIATIVETIVNQIRAHWESIWKVFGPIVKAQFEIVKTTVQTVLNVIAGVVRVFAALLRGDWSAAWGALKGIVSDVLNGVASIVGSSLRGLAGLAKGLAETVGAVIANGIKTAAEKLAGLAGDLAKKISSAASQVAGSAFAYARQIGFALADGVISGIGNLGSRLASAVKSAVSSGISAAGSALHGSGEFMFTKQVVGAPLVEGIIAGIEATKDKLGSAIEKTVTSAVSQGGRGVEGVTKAMTVTFDRWADATKTRMSAAFDVARSTIESNFAAAQAKLEAWKARLTPTEAILAGMEAKAAYASVVSAVTNAKALLDGLAAKQQATFDKLVADQAKNIAALKAAQASTVTDKDIAGHEFQQQNEATASDPLAQNLLKAQQDLDTMKALYAQGQATQQQLFDAQDAFDAASLAAQDDTDAQKLLSDYTTWQGLVAQAAAGAQGIADQEAADAVARQEAQNGFNDERASAQKTYDDALAAQTTYALQAQARKERIARDDAATALNAALVARHDRILKHLENVEHAWDLHSKRLVEDAKVSGKKFTDAFANAIDEATDSNGPIATALKKVANLVAKYLKLNSPAEAGPLSSLDTWWQKLAPTLIASLDSSSIKAALADAVTPNAGVFGPASVGTPGRQELRLNDEELIQKMSDFIDEMRRSDRPGPGVTVIATGGADAVAYASKR